MNRVRKSVSSRIRITKRGKMIRRPMGVDHFKSKKSGRQKRNLRKTRIVKQRDVYFLKQYRYVA